MGNRATVIFAKRDWSDPSPGVYLHWDGGPESVYAFADELLRRRAWCNTPDHAAARFAQVVGDFFDDEHFSGNSLGLVPPPKSLAPQHVAECDCGNDNGVYVFAPNGSTYAVRRFFVHHESRTQPQIVNELTPEEVADERAAAKQHDYNIPSKDELSIAERFTKIGAGRVTFDEWMKRRSERAANQPA